MNWRSFLGQPVFAGLLAVGLLSGCPGEPEVPEGLKELTLSPQGAVLPLGTTRNLIAIGEFEDGSTLNLTPLLIWTSSNEEVAGVEAFEYGREGQVSALSVGTATITAEDPGTGISASVQVSVSDAELESVSLQPVTNGVPKGTSWQLQLNGFFSDGSQGELTTQADWSSSNPDVLTVSNSADTKGYAQAVQRGQATLSAVYSGHSVSIGVQVFDANLVSLEIAAETDGPLMLGQSRQLRAFGQFTDGVNRDMTEWVEWTSSDPGRILISNTPGTKGHVTAAAEVEGADLDAEFNGIGDQVTLSSVCMEPGYTGPFAGGMGTSSDPYRICTRADLDLVRTQLGGHFRLMQDVDLEGVPFTPIGDLSETFSGEFDGNKKTIRNFTYVSSVDQAPTGFFGTLSGTVKSLRFRDASVTGVTQTGILVGAVYELPDQPRPLIADCHVEGTVEGFVVAGGLAGGMFGAVRVERSSARGAVGAQHIAGGLIGNFQANDEWSIADVYAWVNVSASVRTAGGLIGSIVAGPGSEAGSLDRSYALSSVSAPENIGGLVPPESSLVNWSSSYFEEFWAGTSFSRVGDYRSVWDMLTQSTYVGWDFSEVWIMRPIGKPEFHDDDMLPALRSEL